MVPSGAFASRLDFTGADQPNGFYTDSFNYNITPLPSTATGEGLTTFLTFDGSHWGGLFSATDLPGGAIDLDYRFSYQIPASLVGAYVVSMNLFVAISNSGAYPYLSFKVPITSSPDFQHLTIPLASVLSGGPVGLDQIGSFPFAYFLGDVVIQSPDGLAEGGTVPVEMDLKNVAFGEPIPEPSTEALTLIGLAGTYLWIVRRKKPGGRTLPS